MVLESHIGVYCSISDESVYGTYTETSQIFVPLLSESLVQNVSRIMRDQEMTGSNRWSRKPVQNQILPVEGQIKFNWYLDDIAGYFLRAMFGAATSSNLSGSAYKHVWYPGATQSRSLSIGIRRGGNSTEWRFAGCKIKKVSWQLNNDDNMMICTVDIIGQQYSTGDTDAVSGLGTTIAPRFFEASLTDDAGSAQAIVNWSYEIDFALNTDLSKLFKWGQQYIIEPTPAGVMVLRGNVTKNFDSSDDHAIYTAYRALTEYDRLCTFVTTQSIPSGGGNVYRMNVDNPKAIINEYTPPQYAGPGIMQHSQVYDSYEGTTDNSNTAPVEFVLQNATSAYS